MTKVKEEFKVGKNNIGRVDSDFKKEFENDEILPGSILKSHKLTRAMKDEEIIKEFGAQECTLGDILATLNTATEEMKDGYSNIFYVRDHPSHVVHVYWLFGGWDVDAWYRDYGDWCAGERVFSPATDALSPGPMNSESKTLETDICKCERCSKCGKLIK